MAILSFVRILTPLLFLVAILPAVLTGFRDGPAANATGGFGERTCHDCHFDNPLNAPGGTFTLIGIPPRYDPSRAYSITVNLSRADMQRGGFQMAARFASGPDRGKQAGVWRPIDEATRAIAGEDDPAVVFVQHTAQGSGTPEPGLARWTVEWTAPTAGGPVEFNAAGNAANDDASALGDYIYVTSAQSLP